MRKLIFSTLLALTASFGLFTSTAANAGSYYTTDWTMIDFQTCLFVRYVYYIDDNGIRTLVDTQYENTHKGFGGNFCVVP